MIMIFVAWLSLTVLEKRFLRQRSSLPVDQKGMSCDTMWIHSTHIQRLKIVFRKADREMEHEL